MTTKKISELPAAAALTGTETVPIVQAGATVKATVAALVANGTVADATSAVKGKIKLAGDLGGSADVPTVPALAGKADAAATTAALALKAPSSGIAQSAVTNLVTDLSTLTTNVAAKAADSAVVHKTGAETVAGIKTFSSSPVVPDGSFTIAKTTGLQTALDAKALDSAVVKLSGAQTVAGVKTFTSAPGVPDDAFTIAKVDGLQEALDAATGGTAVAAVGIKYVSSYASAGANRVQSAINALPTEGGIVLVDYVGELTVNVITPRANVTIRGLGMYLTTLKVANATNGAVINSQVPGTATGVVIEDLTIDANGANQTSNGWGICFVGSSDTLVRRVKVKNSRDAGIYLYQGANHEVAYCELDDCGTNTTAAGTANGVMLLDNDSARIHHNKITDFWDFGVGILGTGATNIQIDHNLITGGGRGTNNGTSNGGAGGIGIAVGNGNTDVTIDSNIVKTCTGNGIDFGGTTDVTISNNVISACNAGIIQDTAALAADSRSGCTITGNTVRASTNFLGVGAYGIALGGVPRTTENTVTGNLVTGCPSHGILVLNSDHNTITGNTVKNSGTAAAGAGSGQDGIHLADSEGNTVVGNRCFDDRSSKFQAYGVRESGSSNRNALTGNVIHGNLTGGLLTVGAQSISTGNIVA